MSNILNSIFLILIGFSLGAVAVLFSSTRSNPLGAQQGRVPEIAARRIIRYVEDDFWVPDAAEPQGVASQ